MIACFALCSLNLIFGGLGPVEQSGALSELPDKILFT
jgi:hypothetical protein